MFDGKYGKALTVVLAILILIVIGTLIFFAVDYAKNAKINSDASDGADRFEGAVNKQEELNNSNNNEQIDNPVDDSNVELNIQIENIITNTDTDEEITPTNTYKGSPVVGLIEIPKTNLKYPVLENSSKDAIEVSVAVDSGPGLNKVGNTVIIGHNYRNGTFFSNNKNLSNGDDIYITDGTGTKLKYVIYNIYITTPEDSDYMDREVGETKEITLVTCTDDTKSRLVICAKAEE